MGLGGAVCAGPSAGPGAWLAPHHTREGREGLTPHCPAWGLDPHSPSLVRVRWIHASPVRERGPEPWAGGPSEADGEGARELTLWERGGWASDKQTGGPREQQKGRRRESARKSQVGSMREEKGTGNRDSARESRRHRKSVSENIWRQRNETQRRKGEMGDGGRQRGQER